VKVTVEFNLENDFEEFERFKKNEDMFIALNKINELFNDHFEKIDDKIISKTEKYSALEIHAGFKKILADFELESFLS